MNTDIFIDAFTERDFGRALSDCQTFSLYFRRSICPVATESFKFDVPGFNAFLHLPVSLGFEDLVVVRPSSARTVYVTDSKWENN